VPVTDDVKDDCMAEALSPIVCEGDVLGAVIITSRENKMHFSETELKLALAAAAFLGKQM
jgi:AbrB family transcriptional regulator (stage V sporulation protein T)